MNFPCYRFQGNSSGATNSNSHYKVRKIKGTNNLKPCLNVDKNQKLF